MDERLRFVARLLEGEKMAALCREFGISRPTGYKVFNRYKDLGLEGLLDRTRRPYRHANRLPFQVERTIVTLRQEHPTWADAPYPRAGRSKDWVKIKTAHGRRIDEERAKWNER